MRENRSCGSEGGVGESRSLPLCVPGMALMLEVKVLCGP